MSDISLTSSDRASLLSLQRTSDVRDEATSRLATGLQTQSATDDPVAFNQASAIRDRVSDLLNAKDSIGQGISAIESSLDGLDALSNLNDQLRGIARSALGGNDAQRQVAAEQFDTIRQQFDALAADASFGGTSLLTSTSEQLSISINDRGTSIDVQGTSSDSSSLGGLGSASGSFNAFQTDADIRSALGQLDSVRSSLRTSAQDFGGDIASLQARDSFNSQLSNTLEAGAQNLVEADLNEEAARLLAADLREQLGLSGLQITQDSTALLADLI